MKYFFVLLIALSSSSLYANMQSDPYFKALVGEQNIAHYQLISDRSSPRSSILADQRYAVFIHGDENVFDPFLLGSEIRRLERAFGLPVLAYHAHSANELKNILLDLSKRHIIIEALYIRGIHGGNVFATPFMEVIDNANDEFDILSFSDLVDIGVSLNFSPKAFLFMDACEMVDTTSIDTILSSFDALKSLGLESGWIYLNHTVGASATRNLFGVPFYKRWGDRKRVIRDGILNIIGWPVVLPMYYYLDTQKSNQGYLLGFSQNYKVLIETRAHRVQGNQIKGDLIYKK